MMDLAPAGSPERQRKKWGFFVLEEVFLFPIEKVFANAIHLRFNLTIRGE